MARKNVLFIDYFIHLLYALHLINIQYKVFWNLS
jgi:hypothetical protein